MTASFAVNAASPAATPWCAAFTGASAEAPRRPGFLSILTAGAPACGIDLAIHLVERVGGPGLAEAAARELQYERPALAVS